MPRRHRQGPYVCLWKERPLLSTAIHLKYSKKYPFGAVKIHRVLPDWYIYKLRCPRMRNGAFIFFPPVTLARAHERLYHFSQ